MVRCALKVGGLRTAQVGMLPTGRNLFRLPIGPERKGRTGARTDSARAMEEKPAMGVPDLRQNSRTQHSHRSSPHIENAGQIRSPKDAPARQEWRPSGDGTPRTTRSQTRSALHSFALRNARANRTQPDSSRDATAASEAAPSAHSCSSTIHESFGIACGAHTAS